MASKNKENRIVITLEDPDDHRSRYVTTKNRKNTPDRIVLRKFNRFKGQYTEHKEIK
jgi:large subunit ribosomal protein L33